MKVAFFLASIAILSTPHRIYCNTPHDFNLFHPDEIDFILSHPDKTMIVIPEAVRKALLAIPDMYIKSNQFNDAFKNLYVALQKEHQIAYL